MSNEKLVIELQPWRLRIARSPLMWLIVPLAGAAASFLPIMLFQFGSYQASWSHPMVLLCFIGIYAMVWVGIIFGMPAIVAARGQRE